MRQITTPDELNAAANQPEVLPFVAEGFDAIDLGPFFNNPANVALHHEDGVMIFAQARPHIFEGHYLFPKEVRGKAALRIANAMITEMFTKHGAHVIYGDISRTNRAACVFTRALGFHRLYPGADKVAAPLLRFFMTREEWASLFQESQAA